MESTLSDSLKSSSLSGSLESPPDLTRPEFSSGSIASGSSSVKFSLFHIHNYPFEDSLKTTS